MNLTLFLTHQCNLRCDYCYNGVKTDRAMPEQVARKGVALAFAAALSNPPDPVVIRFLGGEPLLERSLLRDCVAYSRRLAAAHGVPVRFALTTNGVLLDASTASWLEEERFSVTVSFDGCRKAQDLHRRFVNGTSSYEATRRGLRIAMDHVSSVDCHAVIEPDTVSDLPASLDELLDLGVHAITFTPDHEAAWNDPQIAALELALRRIEARLLSTYRVGRVVDVEPWDSKIRSHIRGGFPRDCRCPFGRGELAVAPSGRLYPCDRLVRQDDGGELAIGDVDKGVDLSRVASLHAIRQRPDPDCRICELRERCMHWCGCVNVMTSGHLGSPSPSVCRIEQLWIRSADRIAEQLHAEGNALFVSKFY